MGTDNRSVEPCRHQTPVACEPLIACEHVWNPVDRNFPYRTVSRLYRAPDRTVIEVDVDEPRGTGPTHPEAAA